MSASVDQLVDTIVQALKKQLFIEVEASGRHVHLSRQDIDTLFGVGYKLTPVKELSQPGQYASAERVTISGPKGTLKNVVVLGPERKASQVEISLTDALVLGIKAPIRQSGDITGTPEITISNGDKQVKLSQGLIVAKRHMHITPEDANRFHVTDGEIVKVKVFGVRPLIFDDLVVRVSKDFRTYIHIDYDEANACGFTKGTLGMIIK
ncbi:ethanolamine utilization phosphate acetyltransferase EutD [Cellulosilyticum lentocellum]|uniref:Phosphate propanoyltransferase n=1 Tax=Cellulosilyticum lentocellum (strain ATCC 49066 / DSM 5427 / NCIMB 11756 / RHM5) TaxID=642492 RepID=F2JLY1_CELLD|nr:ethanolamine utilization phosphate acetyltransferase EutD [Cellulosilyticum lentocellum]ADZ85761.1 Propanediol utilization protein [Cellulosilyticum lentocellum DSM 5427]